MFKILAIDDDPDIIEQIRHFLPVDDYTVSSAGGAIEAQNKVARQRFDAILLDIGLPGDDGISLLKYFNSTGITRTCPVIMITGTASREIVLTSRQNGASGFLMKPVKAKTLIDQLARSISMRDIQMRSAAKEVKSGKLKVERDSLYVLVICEDKINLSMVQEAFRLSEEASEKGEAWEKVALDLRTQPEINSETILLIKMMAKVLQPAKLFILAGHNFGELIGVLPEDKASLVISEIDLRRQIRQGKSSQ